MATDEQLLEGLKRFLRIPSISTDPARRADVRRAAEFVVDELRSAGLDDAHLVECDGRHPIIRADWLGAPGKPTLLLYGHYDVQPPDPLDEWLSPPFEPTIRGCNIYARGACDDKGQTYILIQALAKLMARDGRLPVNVKVAIEGEEEVGGEHLEQYVAASAAELAADAALICDTEMFAPELPTICVGLRGIVYGELVVEGARTDLHSGVYGGSVPNPIRAIARILAALQDEHGRILIPGFHDRVRPPSPEEREAWSRLPFDPDEYLEKEIGAPCLVGDPSIPVLERLWAQPTLEVHGIRGGFVGEGAKTVIPARALAKVSMRLVADQDPDQATRQLQEAVARVCPPGVRARFDALHAAPPSLVDPTNPYVQAAATALDRCFGARTVFIRSGGSIPVVGLFQRHLGIPSVMAGFGLPDDNLHAPNEKFCLDNFYRGINAIVAYLDLLGNR
jgi:acetylornithine deacetylase/succinyl-diaminopimelate desuccinylase-like protein